MVVKDRVNLQAQITYSSDAERNPFKSVLFLQFLSYYQTYTIASFYQNVIESCMGLLSHTVLV